MAKKKVGRPKKAEVKAKVASEAMGDITPQGSADSPLGADREELYQNYLESIKDETGEMPVPDLELEEDTDDPSEADEKSVKDKVEQEVPEEKIALLDDREDVVKAEEILPQASNDKQKTLTEVPPEEVARQESGTPENEFIKTVPYDALHQERQKRKDIQRQLTEIQRKLADAESVKDQQKDQFPVDADDDAYKSETEKRLEQRLEAMEARFQEDESNRVRAKVDRMIKDVTSELDEAGYPGFEQLGELVVKRRLQDMMDEDPENAADHDNPTGWKKIYVEEYPALRGVFTKIAKEESIGKKTALKSNAGLVGSHGKTDIPKEKSPADYSEQELYDKYLKMRRSGAIT